MTLIIRCAVVMQHAWAATFSTHFNVKYGILNTNNVLSLVPLVLVLSKRASVKTHGIFNDGVAKVRAFFFFFNLNEPFLGRGGGSGDGGDSQPLAGREETCRVNCERDRSDSVHQRGVGIPMHKTKTGGSGRGWRGSKAPRSEVRQSSFTGIAELRSASDFTDRNPRLVCGASVLEPL